MASDALRVEIPGFTILGEVGRGGMGVVYRARQHSLNRVVALKVILAGPAARAEERLRFRIEAEAAARLHHPNIVQIHEVSEAAPDGLGFLVMEFVEGGNLAQYLSGSPLSTRTAAELVATLAGAIQFAHEQGIVHRDLKPANVLLHRVEGRGLKVESQKENRTPVPTAHSPLSTFSPKVTDFGLAKRIEADSDLTGTGQVLGTPSYMAPEQAVGGKNVGPAADVYALGAILYELITGRPPFCGAGLLETLEQVRSQEPVPPSKLQPNLPRDLQTICLKCLEKEPRRRYESAAELAADLRRYLEGEPIRARAVSRWERVIKWSRRKPATAALVALCGFGVVSFVAGLIWHNRRLQAEVKRANTNESIAMANFMSGYDALDQILKTVKQELPESDSGHALYARLSKDATDYFYAVFKDADESDPKIRVARGMLLSYAGDVHRLLGRSDEALNDLRQAEERFQWAINLNPQDTYAREQLALCHFKIGEVYEAMGDFERAEQLHLASIEAHADLIARNESTPRLIYRQACCYRSLGHIYLQLQRPELGFKTLRTSLKFAREYAEIAPADVGNIVGRADACRMIAVECLVTRDWSEAESHLREAETILKESATTLGSPQQMRGLGQTFAVWGSVAEAQGQLDEALSKCDQGIELITRMLTIEPTDKAGIAVLRHLKDKRAKLASSSGRNQDSSAAVGAAPGDVATERRIADESEWAAAQIAAAQDHQVNGRFDEAESVLRDAEAEIRTRAATEGSHRATRALADVYFQWGELELGRDRLDQTIERYDQSIAALMELVAQQAPSHPEAQGLAGWRTRLKAWHLSRAGRTDAAFAAWSEAIRLATEPSDREYWRIERALELALLDHHVAAAQDADRASQVPDLPDGHMVHLARVYSRAIEALSRDDELNEAAADRLRKSYAASAVTGLRRIESTYLADSARVDELDSDPALSALRETEEFHEWRTSFKP
jgi:serine/threonine protein kinase